MAVRMRLKRFGRKNRPHYRIGVFDSHTRRDGRAIEELGNYDPYIKEDDKKYSLNRERINYWLSVGALPSETVESILLKMGIDVPGSGKQRALSPEERAEREKKKEERQKKRELAIQRKAAQATKTKMSREEKRAAKKAGG